MDCRAQLLDHSIIHMARILWAAQFHLSCCYPAVPIALELQRRGHEVVVQSVPDAESMFRSLGFGFRANHRFPAYDFGNRDDAPFSPDEELITDRFWKWWRRSVRDQFADTAQLLADERFDLVLSKSCILLCGAGLAAQARGVPWTSYIHFCFDETESSPASVREAWDSLRRALGVGHEARPDSELYWAPYSPELTLVVGIPELQHRTTNLPRFAYDVGPLAWDPPAGDLHAPWLEGLGTERPAVLVSTSNLWQDDAALVVAAAEGLAGDDVDLVATLPAQHMLPPLPREVIVTGFFPHGQLVPRVQVVVCAAGFGTTQRAILAGIPPVVVPRGGDGRHVARAVAARGVGTVIEPGDVSPDSVRLAVMRSLSDATLAAKISALRDSASRFDAARDSADLIENLLLRRA